jgi:uncharacterized membrane protein
MKRVTFLGTALALAVLVGCNTSERGGKTSDQTPGKETFTVKAPATSTTIKQGDQRTVELTLNRGRDFKQDVTLKADAGTGINVDLEPRTVHASDKATVNATVKAAKDAAIGDHKVTVVATPEKGNATEVTFSVKVEKKE